MDLCDTWIPLLLYLYTVSPWRSRIWLQAPIHIVLYTEQLANFCSWTKREWTTNNNSMNNVFVHEKNVFKANAKQTESNEQDTNKFYVWIIDEIKIVFIFFGKSLFKKISCAFIRYIVHCTTPKNSDATSFIYIDHYLFNLAKQTSAVQTDNKYK